MTTSNEYLKGEFGPYGDLVLDVLHLAGSQHFLSTAPVPPDDVSIIRFLNELSHLGPAYHDQTGEAPLNWDDLLELMRGEYITPPVQVLSVHLSGKIVDRVWEITKSVEGDLRKRLPWLPRNLCRLVQYLVTDCALCRAERGATSEFWERILRCLKSGGIPVGWSGHWPGGQMVVYYPESRDSAGGI